MGVFLWEVWNVFIYGYGDGRVGYLWLRLFGEYRVKYWWSNVWDCDNEFIVNRLMCIFDYIDV